MVSRDREREFSRFPVEPWMKAAVMRSAQDQMMPVTVWLKQAIKAKLDAEEAARRLQG